jgi:hypothetical protein
LVLLALVLTGCPSPSIYGTARTTPVGRVSHTTSLEGVGIGGKYVQGDGTPRDGVRALPTLPSYQVRYGAFENTDVGVRLANFATLGVDLKHNLIEDEVLDLAIDPMLQVSYHPGAWGSRQQVPLYGHLPLLVDLNLSSTVTLVLSPGGMFALAESDISGPYARLGVGLNVRTGKRFAVQPELTALHTLYRMEGSPPQLYFVSLGFHYGSLPEP